MAKLNYIQLTERASKIKIEISLLDYFFKLEELAILRFDGKKGQEYFFGFHHQKTGSISVAEKSNLWYDHAKGDGGDIIKAVQLFENKTFADAINRLDKNDDIIADCYQKFYKRNGETQYEVSINKILDNVEHPALVNYLETRGLELKDIANTGKEVHWTNGKDEFFAIGFENKNGGYAVRSKFFKGNLNGGGISSFTIGEIPKSIKIFEGSMDFSSYRNLNSEESFYAIVLNSTGNLTKKLSENINNKSIEKKIPVHLYFDSGVGGKKATVKALEFIKLAEDKSSFYRNAGCSDINEFLVQQIKIKSHNK